MKKRYVFVLFLSGFLVLIPVGYPQDFIWKPMMSTYQSGTGSYMNFWNLNPVAAMAAGLGDGTGYGTTSSDGVGYPINGSTAYGGPAPDSLVPRGIDVRPGHYYFGFADTYPNTDDFEAYDIGSTPLKSSPLDLYFEINTPDAINFIGICGDGSGAWTQVGMVNQDGTDYLHIRSHAGAPVYSPNGGNTQDTAFGLYINYGNHDAGNEGVDFHGAIFTTNIHWWDIDVPDIPRDKLASIQLSTSEGEEALLSAYIPDSYFQSIGIDPADAQGYVDENVIPLGQGVGETFAFYNYGTSGSSQDLDLDGTYDSNHTRFLIANDNWSTHDLGIGIIPESSSLALVTLLLLTFAIFWRKAE